MLANTRGHRVSAHLKSFGVQSFRQVANIRPAPIVSRRAPCRGVVGFLEHEGARPHRKPHHRHPRRPSPHRLLRRLVSDARADGPCRLRNSRLPYSHPFRHQRALLAVDESWDLPYAAGMRGPPRRQRTLRLGGRPASVVVISASIASTSSGAAVGMFWKRRR